MFEHERIEIPSKPTAQTVDTQLIAQMQALREKIKARRDGKLISADIVEQVRAERDAELFVFQSACPSAKVSFHSPGS